MTKLYELRKGEDFFVVNDDGTKELWRNCGVDGMYARVCKVGQDFSDPTNYLYGMSPLQEVERATD